MHSRQHTKSMLGGVGGCALTLGGGVLATSFPSVCGTPVPFVLPLPLAATSSFSLSLVLPPSTGEPDEKEDDRSSPISSSSCSFFLMETSSFRSFLWSSQIAPFYCRNLAFITPRPRRTDEPFEGMTRGEFEDTGQQLRFSGRSKLRYIIAPLPMMSCEDATARLTIGKQRHQRLLQHEEDDPRTDSMSCRD